MPAARPEDVDGTIHNYKHITGYTGFPFISIICINFTK